MRRGSTRALACALAATAALAGTATAQTADPAERPTLHMGPVDVRPKLVFTDVGVDNNVFNEAENPKRDFTLTAQPDVEFAIKPGPFRLSCLAGTQFVYYREYESERSTNRHFTARLDAELPAVKAFASASYAHTSVRPSSEIDLRAPHRPRTWASGASLKVGYRSSVGFSFRRSEEKYDEELFFRGADLASALNNSTDTYEGSFDVAVTELTTVSLVVAKEAARFERSPLRDSDSIRVAPTVRFSPFGVLTGSASFGYRDFKGIDPALPDYRGFVAGGTVGLKLADRFAVDSMFTRDVRYSYETQLPYYLTTAVQATVTTLVGAGFEVRGTAGRESMDYRALAGESAPGRDRRVVYGGGGGVRIAERLRLIVEVEFSERTSERDRSREYTNNRVFATLNWGAFTR